MFMFRAENIKCEIGFVEPVRACRFDIIAFCRRLSQIIASERLHRATEVRSSSLVTFSVSFLLSVQQRADLAIPKRALDGTCQTISLRFRVLQVCSRFHKLFENGRK